MKEDRWANVAARAGRLVRNVIDAAPESADEGSLEAAPYRRLRQTLRVALALGLVVYLMAPTIGAELGAIDDHEIPVIARHLAEQGLLGTVATQLSEHNGRFRPVYWLGRVAETAVWGEWAGGWYVDRTLLLLATLAAAYALARLRIRPNPALLGAILVVAGPQAEVFTRLGPQEAYAVPLTLVGFVLVGRRRTSLGLASLVAAAFTKEAFLIVPLIGLVWAWRLGARWPVAAAAAGTAVAALGVGLAIAANSGDYYHQVRSPQAIAVALRDLATQLAALTAWPLALTLSHWRLVLLVGLLLAAWQTAVLAGIGIAGRYLFPLVIPAAMGSAIAARRRPALIVVLALVALGNLWTARIATQQYVAATHSWQRFIAALEADPRPVVLVVNRPANAERPWAIRQYIPDKPMALRAPFSLPGFVADVGPDCLELLIDGPATGVCPEARQIPTK